MSLYKKILSVLGIVVELLLLAGIYVFHYFTEKKLGMRRWVNFNSNVIEAKVGSLLPTTVLILLCLFTVVVLVLAIRSFLKARSKWAGLSIVITALLTIFMLVISLCYDRRSLPEMDFTFILLSLSIILQNIRCLMISFTKGKSHV